MDDLANVYGSSYAEAIDDGLKHEVAAAFRKAAAELTE
jgi:hypothetical protein